MHSTGRNVAPGSRRDLFIRGPLNTARAGCQGMYNLIGGKVSVLTLMALLVCL